MQIEIHHSYTTSRTIINDFNHSYNNNDFKWVYNSDSKFSYNCCKKSAHFMNFEFVNGTSTV